MKKWKHQFFRRLRAANSVVLGQTWPNCKLIQALMYVIITCKYEKDPIKNNREKGATPGRIANSAKLLCMSSLSVSMKRIPSRTTEKKGQHHFQIITLSVAMETSGRIWPNFELIQASVYVLIAGKYEKDQMKNSVENVMTSFSPL